MKSLTTAIFSKCASGTNLHTAIGGRLFKGRAPEGAEYPYVVYQLISDVPDHTFTEEFEEVTIQFSLFSSLSSSLEVENMYAYLKQLYDDCSLTLSGSTVLWFERTNATLMSETHTTKNGDAEVWHYAVDYNILIQLGTGEGEFLFVDTEDGLFEDTEDGLFVDG